MSPGTPEGRRGRWSATGVVALVVGAAALHVGAPVFMPVALAIIVAFILHPLAGLLERWVGRVAAVALVVVVAWAVLGGITWGVTRQVMSFARELPQYREQLLRRVGEFRRMTRDPGVETLQSTIGELVDELNTEPGEKTAVVVVRPEMPAIVSLPTLGRVVASAGLVTLLVAFFLLERQALRNRVLRLAGRGRLAMTTRALEDASQRISRYLVTQAALNVMFGVAAGLGLAVLGIPYALGFGVLAAILKFVPFIGFWAAMAPPVLFSVATAPGWTQPALVAGLYLGLAIASTFLLEPVLHAQRLGISRVALVLGLAFWAWLWGPVGLVIATPLTVCLIVLGRHVPELRHIAVLIGDEPALLPHVAFYQRLLAGDHTEAMELAEAYRASHSGDAVFDDVMLPALALAKLDRVRGELLEEDAAVLAGVFARVVRELDVRAASFDAPAPGVLVVGCPAEDVFDHAALLVVQESMPPDGGATIDVVSPALMSSDVVTVVTERHAPIVCIAALPSGGFAQARYLVKRLRQRAPEVRIVVALFGAHEAEAERAALMAAGADGVGTTVVETRERLLALVQFARGAISPAA
jgi:predicted PurR-regulated permease PerM